MHEKDDYIICLVFKYISTNDIMLNIKRVNKHWYHLIAQNGYL